ncbi:uncharacterized protein LOC105420860 [Amborella trichopoda]|uniref:uncharacterized protein LOC105420860 n=1 Tax=Amborella trichopoda TaxID=13333 RepID=UPI0005D2DA64|nr:uncharacterized protein LOC105420860 [Amborella trichopoda]|eukprot:XP_011624397.1 uncharacterized protein LOC105420860 [Amborella trichopoda]
MAVPPTYRCLNYIILLSLGIELIFFPLASVKALPRLSSDHTPILLCTKVRSIGPEPLKLETSWLVDKEVLDLVKSGWENYISFGSVDFQLYKKLLCVKHKLISWRNDKGPNVKAKIEEVLNYLTDVDARIQNSRVFLEELAVARSSKINELHELRRVEEVRRQNDVSRLFIEGVDPENLEGLSNAVVGHFKKAFTNEVRVTPRLSRVGFSHLAADSVALLERENCWIWVVIKLDMEKAYDMVKLNILLEIMKNMGFGEKWRSWMFGCLSSTYFSILFKGSPTGFFGASHGLRQGDSLSPFLYTIYVECFSRLLYNVQAKGHVKGFQMPNNGPCISHLQYADDTLLFCEANCDQVENIVSFLQCWEVALRIKMNFEKSTAVGINCVDSLIYDIARVLGCKMDVFPIW